LSSEAGSIKLCVLTNVTMSHAQLYFVELRGDSRARGLQHGRHLQEPIGTAIAFYQSFFRQHLGIDVAEMRRRAARFIEPTARLSSALTAELEGIAEGAGQRLDDIFAINARYEITFEQVKLGECSNVFVGSNRSRNGHTLMGMNWEWRPEVLDFRAVILARCEDMPDHIVVTECGQPGKYGINAAGIGAIETGLGCGELTSSGDQLFGLLIRHQLAQEALQDAVDVLVANRPYATISFFAADDSGCGVNIEAAPRRLFRRQMTPDDLCWHTNHCLLSEEPCRFEDSYVRGRRWEELVTTDKPIDWQTVGDWLADTRDGPNGICKTADSSQAQLTSFMQTLTSIVLDPAERVMWVSDGPACAAPYRRFDFNSNMGATSYAG
jgi:isopenicillin-N N-acyltransferase-like protein